MRVGIAGGGFGLDVHLPAFAAVAGVEVVAVADSGSGKVRQRLPAGITYASSWRELLAADLDVVSVATPPCQQHEIVVAALAQGKHIFCEKPFGATLAQAQAIADCARRVPSSVVAVNFQFRYERGIALLKEKLGAGLVGEVRAIDFSWLTAGRASPQTPWTWRNDVDAGGGAMSAFFSHAADLLCWLTSAEVDSVFGQTRILVPERMDDTGRKRIVTAEDAVVAQLTMADRVSATCRVTNCQPGGDGMRIDVHGVNGVLSYRHVPPFGSEDQSLELRTREGASSIPLVGEEAGQTESRMHATYRCVADFAARVAGDTLATPPSLGDALRVQRIMKALRDSAVSGCAVPIAIGA